MKLKIHDNNIELYISTEFMLFACIFLRDLIV